jgi:hypothetical protein
VGESNALAAAKAAGLPEAVLARARERMGLNDNGGQPGGGVSEKERLVSALVEALNAARATEAAAEAQRGAAMAELEAARALTGEAQRRLRAATDAAAAGSARLAQREASIAEVSLILGGPIGSHLLGRFGTRVTVVATFGCYLCVCSHNQFSIFSTSGTALLYLQLFFSVPRARLCVVRRSRPRVCRRTWMRS